jgi:exodeoxyribonuclease VII small subunit
MPKTPISQTADDSDALSGLSYENAMEELEDIVAAMDNDRLPLEEMLVKYERGNQLLKVCQTRLKTAQHKIELIQTGKSGAQLTPMEPTDSGSPTQTPPSSAKARRPAAKATDLDDDNENCLF